MCIRDSLSRDERVYRGRDGRYYCRRNDGTTGLIVGGIAGGVLGNIIAPGNSETLGTLLGAAGGAIAGQAIDRNNTKCRLVECPAARPAKTQPDGRIQTWIRRSACP